MTKKDYNMIAEVLRQARHNFRGHSTAQKAIDYITQALADEFELNNPRFDRALWFEKGRLV